MEDCLEELEEAQAGPDWWGCCTVSIGILVYRTCPVEPSLVSSLLAEAGSLQVLPGCLEDRKGDIFLTPPSLRLLAREEEGDDDVLSAGLQSLALEQESVLVTAALSVAGSEASQAPAWFRVRRSEALKSLADPQPDVTQSGLNTENWSNEREQLTEDTGRGCVARWEEDDTWYRAEVLSFQEDHLHVVFTDYGNEAEVVRERVRWSQADIPEGELKVPEDPQL